MGGRSKQPETSEDETSVDGDMDFTEAFDEIHKVLGNRVFDITNAYLESGKDVEWYIHFIRCLDSIKKGPPAKDAVDAEDTGSNRSRKRQRADSRSDADADGDSPKPAAGTVGKDLTTSGPATYMVLEGPAIIRVKTEGFVAVRVTQAATVRIEEARKVQVQTERGKFTTTFEAVDTAACPAAVGPMPGASAV